MNQCNRRKTSQDNNLTIILNHHLCRRRCGLDLHIMSTQDVVNAFKNVNKGFVGFPQILYWSAKQEIVSYKPAGR